MERVLVAGIGMIPFTKPGKSLPWDKMGTQAAREALEDAGIDYNDVGQAYAGYVYGDTTSGESVVYELGLSGIPIVNVNNACATGSTALFLARQAVAGGACDVALAVGFEQMNPGALQGVFKDREPPLKKSIATIRSLYEMQRDAPFAAQFFDGAAREHQSRYGTKLETFASISAKARRHAERNPRAVFRDPLTVEEVLASPTVVGIITRYQACPPTCGAAAAVLVSECYTRRKGLTGLVEIAGQAFVSDTPESFTSMLDLAGSEIAGRAARSVYEQTGVGPDDVDVVELHDCFSVAEVIFSEALGLCGPGECEKMVADGDNSYGGRYVINPSGGLLAKGHPLGATGLAQCFELVQQLRGQAGPRQVEGARHALAHNGGLGAGAFVTLYRAPSRGAAQ